MVECYECGKCFDPDTELFGIIDDEYYCEDCANDEWDNYSINPYGDHPCWYKRGDETTIHYGVELEVDNGGNCDGCANRIAEITDDVYMCEDCSLDEGFEIISMPCTLDYHLNNLGWDKIIKTCCRYKFQSHDAGTCGLHIHIGTDTIEDKELFADKCIVLCDAIWYNGLIKFARRSVGAYVKKPNTGAVPTDTSIDVRAKTTRIKHHHFQAINIGKANTVEFRIFRGTLNIETFYATLTFVDLFVDYALNHSLAECITATFNDIVRGCDDPYLVAYLKRRNLMEV